MVRNRHLRLWVADANWTRRRKSWNIEFRGDLANHPAGAVLIGATDIPDRRRLHVFIWLIRVIGGVIAAVGAAMTIGGALSGAGLDLLPVALALVTGTALWIGTIVLETDGQRAAAADAQLLIDFLRLTLEIERAGPHR